MDLQAILEAIFFFCNLISQTATQFFSEDLLDKHMGNHGIVLQVIPYFGITDFVCFHYPAFFHSCTSRCLQPFLIKDECVEVLNFTQMQTLQVAQSLHRGEISMA